MKINKFKSFLKVRLVARPFRNPKSFLTPTVFVFASLALIPGWVVAFILGTYEYPYISIITYPVFIFYAIFWFIVSVNNQIYLNEKKSLEHLILVNQLDTVDLLMNFTKYIPADSKPENIQSVPSIALISLMADIFGKGEPVDEKVNLFVECKGDVIIWCSYLTKSEREILFRYSLPQ